MARLDELNSSREGLLRQNRSTGTQLRPSLEEAYRSSSEDQSLDELDLMNEASPGHHHRQAPYKDLDSDLYSTTSVHEKGKNRQPQHVSRIGKLRRLCRPRRTCLIITLVVFVILIVALGGSGFWAYKKSPDDGVLASNLSPHRFC